MFYVSSMKNGKFGVTDTKDGVEEFYSKEELFSFCKMDIDISGVDTRDFLICKVVLIEDTLDLFKQRYNHLAISTMGFHTNIGFRFQSKPTRGEMCFVNNRVLNIYRQGVNRFTFDYGHSKSLQSNLTLDDIMMVLSNFSDWRLIECKAGRY